MTMFMDDKPVTAAAMSNPIFVRLDMVDIATLLTFLEDRCTDRHAALPELPDDQAARLYAALQAGQESGLDENRSKYLEAAEALHARDGEIEFDSDGIISESEGPGDGEIQGAYVQGWVYVSAEELEQLQRN